MNTSVQFSDCMFNDKIGTQSSTQSSAQSSTQSSTQSDDIENIMLKYFIISSVDDMMNSHQLYLITSYPHQQLICSDIKYISDRIHYIGTMDKDFLDKYSSEYTQKILDTLNLYIDCMQNFQIIISDNLNKIDKINKNRQQNNEILRIINYLNTHNNYLNDLKIHRNKLHESIQDIIWIHSFINFTHLHI